MEVPCCSSMSIILTEAIKRVGVAVKTTRIIISRDGKILETTPVKVEI